MSTLSRLARPATGLMLAVAATLLSSGCAQTGSDARSMGAPGTSATPDQPVGGRAVLRPVPPSQNLPGGDSTGSP